MEEPIEEHKEGSKKQPEVKYVLPQDVEKVPLNDANQFRHLFRLSSNILANLTKEAMTYQMEISNAKTKPKVDLFTKKFNKVKVKFHDEFHRLHQIKHIMEVNDISFEDSEFTEKDKPIEGDEE